MNAFLVVLCSFLGMMIHCVPALGAARRVRAAFSCMARVRYAGYTMNIESCMRPQHAEIHQISSKYIEIYRDTSRWSRGSSHEDAGSLIAWVLYVLYSRQRHQLCPRKMGCATASQLRFRLVGPWNLRCVRAKCGTKQRGEQWLLVLTCSTCSDLKKNLELD